MTTNHFLATLATIMSALFCCGIMGNAAATPQMPTETPLVFAANDGRTVDAFAGTFTVPENRQKKDSPLLTLHYVRFPAIGDQGQPPIVYLAGGPGGSGINAAKGPRFDLFMALRTHGDVIAFDQRGTGKSDQTKLCTAPQTIAGNRVVPTADLVAAYREAALHCFDWWQGQGIDPYGYTTVENARDLAALRRHLGAEKISLWGISYGTHLALAAMKIMPRKIHKAVLASVEGLDQTVKLPARTDAYFDRLQRAINKHPTLSVDYPDLVAMIRRVQRSADDNPQMVQVPQRTGGTTDLLVTGDTFRMVTGFMVSDPPRALALLSIYRAADSGDYGPLIGLMARFYQGEEAIQFRTMSLAMDVASGVSNRRMHRVNAQAKDAIVGSMLNFPMPQLRGAIPDLDLGRGFRRSPRNRIPTLVLSGTLDGRTYPAGHREATDRLRNRTIVTVENAGHNLFMVSPEVTAVISGFLAGKETLPSTITIPLSKEL
ncbi:MAG: alpha/beta hydrolase [Pseudomonadota bacterium]